MFVEDRVPETDLRATLRAAIGLAILATAILVMAAQASLAGEPQAAGPARDDRERLRYAGRRFEDWRDQLLHDLDPKTCMQAMAPMAAFGRRGYEDEAIAALGRMPHDDRYDVAMEACDTLGQIGAKAVAALVGALTDERPQVRTSAAKSLGRLGRDASPATEALAKLLDDEHGTVCYAATQALVMVAADNEALHPTFRRLAESDDVTVRRAFVDGLKAKAPHDGLLLQLLIRAVDDEDPIVRSIAGPTLARCGPPNEEVIGALKRLLGGSDPQAMQNTMNMLGNPGNTATKIRLLAKLVNSPEEFENLRGQMTRAINLLGGAREHAEIAVPALAAIIEGKVAGLNDAASVAAAIDAVGRIGPAAKRAVPVLERWIFDERPVDLANGDTLEKHARLALRKVVGAEAER